ncbi:TPA: Holliday junction resolvase RuvX [Candidatus Gracilibacteria bacterium]|nr:Holliday junction resolvase RuvX [Candidatus Gracilibacteria bacterium]HIQ57591.1 Holliday junction resolvase RuvX [Candidatus Gracilibacteria bacterium]
MKIIGLDIGFARVGVAIGESDIKLAFPREQLKFEEYLPKLQKIIREENVTAIVIGDPKSSENLEDSSYVKDSGKKKYKNDHREKTLREKENIKLTLGLPVFVFDERFTTQIAEASLTQMGVKMKKQKNSKDSVAAAIILQNWFDSVQFYSDVQKIDII